jgi:hypothetical protein
MFSLSLPRFLAGASCIQVFPRAAARLLAARQVAAFPAHARRSTAGHRLRVRQCDATGAAGTRPVDVDERAAAVWGQRRRRRQCGGRGRECWRIYTSLCGPVGVVRHHLLPSAREKARSGIFTHQTHTPHLNPKYYIFLIDSVCLLLNCHSAPGSTFPRSLPLSGTRSRSRRRPTH